jgi:hypothetical protein
MITYSKSFKTEENANSFLNLLANKKEFIVSKVANAGGDIYFLEPIPQMSDEEINQIFRDESGFEINTCPIAILDFARAILKKASEK